VVAPLALLPYVPGLIVWSLAGIAVLIPAVRAYFKGAENRWLLTAAPAVAVNIGLGQNGALTAALLLGGLALWRTRPKLSGFVLALLVFKPQLALLLPIAVVAERRWSTMATAALTVIAVLVLSTLIFGVDAWNGFFGPAMTTQRIMLSQGRGPFQWMMPSAFMAGRVAGLSVGWALLVQAPVSLFAGWLVWRAYRRDGDAQGKGAILVMATFLASPQMFNYDLIPGAAAALVLLRRDRTIVGFCLAIVMWALPVLLLATQVVHIAVGPFVIAAVTVRLAAVCGAIRLMRWPFRWPFPRRAFRPGPR
jgi:alpha-1,2-mannosyltransferase